MLLHFHHYKNFDRYHLRNLLHKNYHQPNYYHLHLNYSIYQYVNMFHPLQLISLQRNIFLDFAHISSCNLIYIFHVELLTVLFYNILHPKLQHSFDKLMYLKWRSLLAHQEQHRYHPQMD